MAKKVEEYMKPIAGLMVTTDENMLSVVRTMLKASSPVVAVTDANRHLRGIITGSDVIREIEKAVDSPTLLQGTAEYVMTRHVISVPKGTIMIGVVEEMFRHRLHTLIVTYGYAPVGIVTQTEVIRWWLEQNEGLASRGKS